MSNPAHEPETIAFCTQVKVTWMATSKTMRQWWMAKQGDALQALKAIVSQAESAALSAGTPPRSVSRKA